MIGYQVLVLGACCSGKSSLLQVLLPRLHVVETDDAVLQAAGGSWPSTLDETHGLVVATAGQALAFDRVVHITSFVPTAMIRSARANGFTVALLDVPRDELERRNLDRLRRGQEEDMSHWFDMQVENYEDLAAAGLIDVVLDGTRPLEHVAESIVALTGS